MSSELGRVTNERDELNARVEEIEEEEMMMEVDSYTEVPINPEIEAEKENVSPLLNLPARVNREILDYLDFESRLAFQQCCSRTYALVENIPRIETSFLMEHVDSTKMIITMSDEKRDYKTKYVFEKNPNTTTKNQVEFRREDRMSYARIAFKFLGKLCSDKRVDVKKMSFSLEHYHGPADIGVRIPRLDLLRIENFISDSTYPSLLQCFGELDVFEFHSGRSWCGCVYNWDPLVQEEVIEQAETLVISSCLSYSVDFPAYTSHEKVLYRCSLYGVFELNKLIEHFLITGPYMINDGKQEYRFEFLDLLGDREKIGEGLIVYESTSDEITYAFEGSIMYAKLKFVGLGVKGFFGLFDIPFALLESGSSPSS